MRKKLFVAIAIFFVGVALPRMTYASEACDTKGKVYADKDVLRLLKIMPGVFMAYEVDGGGKDVYLQRGKEKIRMVSGFAVQAGDILKTGPNQKIKITFFMPMQTHYEIQENSDVQILSIPNEECSSVLQLNAGQIMAKGDHKMQKRCEARGEVVTPNAVVVPEGTEYKVSVPSRKQRKTFPKYETFEVSEGKILVKLKRVPTTTRSELAARKYAVHKNQRARIIVNKRTKLAEIEYFTPN